jgi:hypothetical protein
MQYNDSCGDPLECPYVDSVRVCRGTRSGRVACRDFPCIGGLERNTVLSKEWETINGIEMLHLLIFEDDSFSLYDLYFGDWNIEPTTGTNCRVTFKAKTMFGYLPIKLLLSREVKPTPTSPDYLGFEYQEAPIRIQHVSLQPDEEIKNFEAEIDTSFCGKIVVTLAEFNPCNTGWQHFSGDEPIIIELENPRWDFGFEPVASKWTPEGYTITYKIYNYKRKACRLPVEIYDKATGEAIKHQYVEFSDGEFEKTVTFGHSSEIRARAYKYDVKYGKYWDVFGYYSDPSGIEIPLPPPENFEVAVTVDKTTAAPGEQITATVTVKNYEDRKITLTIDLTKNGSEIGVPKTVTVEAKEEASETWTLRFSTVGDYEICPLVTGGSPKKVDCARITIAEPEKATVTVSTVPAGANVYVDGKYVGMT